MNGILDLLKHFQKCGSYGNKKVSLMLVMRLRQLIRLLSTLINSNRKMFKYEWIWKKNRFSNFVNAKKMPMRCIEYIFIFYKEQPIYNPILRKSIHHHEKRKILI
jgi:hypothetical protein